MSAGQDIWSITNQSMNSNTRNTSEKSKELPHPRRYESSWLPSGQWEKNNWKKGLLTRVARFFLVHDNKSGKMYQMHTKCTKWSSNILNVNIIFQMTIKYINFFHLRPSKINTNWDFWFVNKPSGNPVADLCDKLVSRKSGQIVEF
jgi:hypothetical protein